MVAAPSGGFRTLDDVLGGAGKAIGNDGAALMGTFEHNPGLINRIRGAAIALDPVVDAAVINSATNAVPDDTAQRVGGRVADRLNPDKQLDALKNGYSPETGKSPVAGPKQVNPKPNKPPVKPVEEAPSMLDKGVGIASDALGYVAFVPLATELAPMVLGGAAKFVTGSDKVRNTLNKPNEWMSKHEVMKGVTGRQALNDGIQIGFGAIQSYTVAKGALQQLKSLKEMYADVTGVDANSVSTMDVLTGKVPPVLAEARAHYLKEFGSRVLIQAVGWGLVARDLMRGKLKSAEEIASGRIGLTAGLVPGLVGMGIDAMMGTSSIEMYSGFKKAFDSGEVIPAGAYAQFVMVNSPDLQKRKVGPQVALELGAEYAKEKASPAEILRQINDGRFKARIEQMIVKDEAALAAKQQLKAQVQQSQGPVSMVDRINGHRQQPGKVVGQFTGRLQQESAMQNKELH